MRRRVPNLLLLTGLLLLAAPRQARAAAWEVFGGFALSRESLDAVNLEGATIAASHDVRPGLGIATDLTLARHRVEAAGSDITLTAMSLAAGPRFSVRIGRVREFGECLIGVMRTTGSAFGATTSDHTWTVAPGGGLIVSLTSRISAQAGFSAVLKPTGTAYRFTTGVVLPLP